MCLYSKTVKPKKADKDIICYKVLIKDRQTGTLRAPVASYTYELNKVHTAERAKRIDIKEITSGYFHTFNAIYEADKFCRATSKWVDSRQTSVIFRCKIPEGTYYYEGVDNCYRFGYASKKLVLLEEVKDLWEPL